MYKSASLVLAPVYLMRMLMFEVSPDGRVTRNLVRNPMRVAAVLVTVLLSSVPSNVPLDTESNLHAVAVTAKSAPLYNVNDEPIAVATSPMY